MTNDKPDEAQTARFPHLRDAVRTVANTALTVDFISVLESEPHAAAPGLTIKYVPDKLILTSQGLARISLFMNERVLVKYRPRNPEPPEIRRRAPDSSSA